jgi:hypothetical protein
MRLDDLCDAIAALSLPGADAREHPDRDSVIAARSAVADAVLDDEFLLDCMSRELELIERNVPRRESVPFFTTPNTGITFAFRYWAPGSNAGAHEHTAWTITAVCRNKLSVSTFDRESSYRNQALVSKKVFDAPAGRTGYIYEPCIHDPRNPTDRWSISLHVTSPRDGEQDPSSDMCLPILDRTRPGRRKGTGDARDWVIDARVRHSIACQIAGFVAARHGARADRLLSRCVRSGPLAVRRFGKGRLDSGEVMRPHRYTRTHRDLTLTCQDRGDYIALGVETDKGWIEQMRMARIAAEALAFCASAPAFTIDEIPGPITSVERLTIVDALERVGVMWPEAC